MTMRGTTVYTGVLAATMRGTITVAYRSGPDRVANLDERSTAFVDGPAKDPQPTQPRDTHSVRTPHRDELTGLRLDGNVVTVDHGDQPRVRFPVDARSLLVVEGPGSVAGGWDLVNRVTARLPLAGAVSVTYSRLP